MPEMTLDATTRYRLLDSTGEVIATAESIELIVTIAWGLAPHDPARIVKAAEALAAGQSFEWMTGTRALYIDPPVHHGHSGEAAV